ncbi:unnamed protein product, partial [Mesorhabditis belari]|uniref:Uncharacterized protein n=1 Tax=Mesorhabditis belari TaxID=2138241 RepID=A0AAF3EU95_9BILA
MIGDMLRLVLLSILLGICLSAICENDSDCFESGYCFENECQQPLEMHKRVLKMISTRSAAFYCETDNDCLIRQDYRNTCNRNQCVPLWLNRLRMG